jgi:hypothetical protein
MRTPALDADEELGWSAALHRAGPGADAPAGIRDFGPELIVHFAGRRAVGYPATTRVPAQNTQTHTVVGPLTWPVPVVSAER